MWRLPRLTSMSFSTQSRLKLIRFLSHSVAHSSARASLGALSSIHNKRRPYRYS